MLPGDRHNEDLKVIADFFFARLSVSSKVRFERKKGSRKFKS
jgi:hypothetical protein